ncbi:two-component system sensor histidine kinase NtrB [Krasilnikovia sp. MM14-A1004]|uniref:two-component system sensor histidine kinase NtrB n=1 Tax=Krasilnikovia sp. MM14-A1004 TaxID=3373541 RepID=UPI00399C7848
MKREDRLGEGRSLTHGWWRVGVLGLSVLIVILIGLVDLATPPELTAFGLFIVVGPVLAVVSARPRAVAAVGMLAALVAWAVSSWQGLGGTAHQQVRLWVIAGMTGLSVAVAASLRAMERRADGAAERESMLAAIVPSSRDAIVAADLQGRILSYNHGAELMYGYTAAEMIGQSVTKVLPSGPAARLPGVLARVAAGEGLSHFPSQRRRKDGTIIDVSTSVSPIRDRHGTIIGVATISRDLSARQRAEEQHRQIMERSAHVERLEGLGQLAGGIAHDFNNLLAINLNYLEFALEQTTDPGTYDDLTRARNSAERAGDLTRKLLMFAREEPGSAEDIDLNTMLTGSHSLLQRVIGTHVELVSHPAGEPLIVHADRSRIEHALLNLVINARDAMPHGGMVVIEGSTVSFDDDPACQPPLPPGRYAELKVSNTSTENATPAYEPLSTGGTQHHDMGLSLATVHGIITAAGGAVTVDTESGVGASIRMLLPLTAEGAGDPGPFAVEG